MNNKDNLQKFIFENASVRGELVRIDQGFQQIMQQHNYPPAIRQLLGEALVAANLLSSIIKFEGRLTVQFQGKGKLKLLLAQCNHELQFRGLAQWTGEPDLAELTDALQNGTLAIMIDPISTGKQRYQGIVSWQGDSLARSIEGYFKDSEQLPTRLWIEVSESSAVGLLLQILPKDASANQTDDWEHITQLTDTLKPEELLHLDNATLLHRLYHQEKVRVFDPAPVEFRCTCSAEKSENALLLLGKEEVDEELRDKQQILVTCEFCNRQFTFDRVDIAKIFIRGNDASTQVH